MIYDWQDQPKMDRWTSSQIVTVGPVLRQVASFSDVQDKADRAEVTSSH